MKAPVTILSNPKLADAVIKWFQVDFQTNIAWFTSNGIKWVYGKIVAGVTPDKLTYPKMFNPSDKDSYDIEPDSNQKAYGFFRVVNSFKEEDNIFRYNLDFIVWGNLSLVDPTKNYDFTSELIQDVLDRLNAMYPLNNIDLDSINVFENPEDVFTEYSFILQEKTQHLMKPYFGFRINFDVLDVCGAGGAGCSGGDTCSGVDIIDQSGAIIAHVSDGSTYSVLVFSGIDEGNASTVYTNSIVEV
jgi:hypothetical protein